jgi:hypothetical protein
MPRSGPTVIGRPRPSDERGLPWNVALHREPGIIAPSAARPRPRGPPATGPTRPPSRSAAKPRPHPRPRPRPRLAALLVHRPPRRLVQAELVHHRHDRQPERRAPHPPPRAVHASGTSRRRLRPVSSRSSPPPQTPPETSSHPGKEQGRSALAGGPSPLGAEGSRLPTSRHRTYALRARHAGSCGVGGGRVAAGWSIPGAERPR